MCATTVGVVELDARVVDRSPDRLAREILYTQGGKLTEFTHADAGDHDVGHRDDCLGRNVQPM